MKKKVDLKKFARPKADFVVTNLSVHVGIDIIKLCRKHKEINWSKVGREAVLDVLRELGEDV